MTATVADTAGFTLAVTLIVAWRVRIEASDLARGEGIFGHQKVEEGWPVEESDLK
jgi:hypothetical protein